MKNWRFYAFVFFICFVFAIIIFRLFTLQITKHGYYETLADKQHQDVSSIIPARGGIYMKDKYVSDNSVSSLFPVALTKNLWKIYAAPKEIKEKEEIVYKLSPLLGINEIELMEKISIPNDSYELLKDKVDEGTAEKIKNLKLKGIGMESEKWRYFPNNEMACHLLGFVGYDGDKKVGRYGIEEYYEKELGGKPGKTEVIKDASGRLTAVGDKILEESEQGADIVLTIDPNIQFFIEKKLKETIDKLAAIGGTIIIMDIKTGAIKGMANWPFFDPNKYNEVKNINIFLNSATYGLFEPGSIMKPITMAAALDKGIINPNTTYEDKGFVNVGDRIIKNYTSKANGVQTMTQVLEKSLNTGAVFVQQKMGKDIFREYLEKFGFNDKTGIDLKSETKGNLSNLKGDVEYATAAFGQGIAVTPIEIITAFSAIANDGVLMRPYVVDKIIYKNGKEEKTEPKEVRRVISSDTASRLTAMMVSVVKNSFDRKASVPGYLIAGKTGTAQIPDFQKGGYSDQTIHSFGGFFPAYNAKFSVLIKVDEPKGIRFASDSITPLFRQIAEYLLNYYEIPPSE